VKRFTDVLGIKQKKKEYDSGS